MFSIVPSPLFSYPVFIIDFFFLIFKNFFSIFFWHVGSFVAAAQDPFVAALGALSSCDGRASL